ncbi:MAG: BMP family ABC transporter substrate-binding protein, partial [Oscillospiraceae bacterium]|nr:BMP family ABC transporter substrate-binding protein [Oscillospiraceae bacterium]
PNASIISARADWSKYLIYAVECVLNGEEIVTDWCKGYAEGANFTSPLNTAVAAEGTQEVLDEVAQGIIDGTVHVFAGPWSGYYVWDGSEFECAEGEWVEESTDRSSPYFGYIIDGITRLDA